MNLHVVILAAGQGTRMRSKLPKVLHPVAGKPMLGHVIDCARSLSPTRIHVVIGHGAELVRERLVAEDIHWVLQTEQLGTGHAVAQALPGTEGADQVLVLYGDVPLLRVDTLQQLSSQAGAQALGMLTVTMADPTGYGRIVRDAAGQVQAIVEHKDATDAQRQIREVNTGIMALPARFLKVWLPKLSADNAQGEYYLTDIVAMAHSEGVEITSAQPEHPMEVEGANNRVQLSALERAYQAWQAEELMLNGATLADPARIDVRGEVTTGEDVLIDVNVIFEGKVTIGNNVQIGPNCVLKDCTIGDNVVIKANSLVEEASVAAKCTLGPYARLRPGAIMEEDSHIGNFVEMKKTRLGKGSKANHLTYLGDTEVGEKVNIGAGTITCNYDGVNKSKTIIGDNAFIGSNSSLVAPVNIGAMATVGAGSVITNTVEDEQLAVARGKQRNLTGWKRPTKK